MLRNDTKENQQIIRMWVALGLPVKTRVRPNRAATFNFTNPDIEFRDFPGWYCFIDENL